MNEPFHAEVTEFRGTDSSWAGEWKEFLAAIRGKRQPLGNATDGLEAMRLVFSAYEAARRGSEVPLLRGAEQRAECSP